VRVRVVVPGDRPVRIVARHATLRADPDRGSVVLTEPVADVVTLRVIEGPVIEFTTPRPGCAVRVRIAVHEGQAEPPVTVTVTRVEPPEYSSSSASQGADEVTVAGLGAGRFEVVVRRPGSPDPRGFVRTVELDGEHDVVVDYAPR
jgi:hypothetical protein